MKNERMLRILIFIIIVPVISLLAGYLVSQNIIEPNISKGENSYNFDELNLKGIDIFQVVLGNYSSFEDAKYNDDLMKMKNVYSFIYKNSDEYLLIGGIFLEEEQASLFSSRLKSQGLGNDVYVYRGPVVKLRYDKKITNEVVEFEKTLQRFKEILDYMSALSYKASNDKLQDTELERLKEQLNFFRGEIKNFNDESLNKIEGKMIEIIDKITEEIKKIQISVALNDKNSFRLLQENLWQSCNEYNEFLKSIAIKNK
ncbi:hypothetical protein [Thermoanaerobacter kivui]|nr:hypothetical protein [Thermoanaerobacter kivui]